MLTIETLEKIKTGARITFFNGIFAIIFGVAYLGFMEFILKYNMRIIDVVWQVFYKYNNDLASIIVRLTLLKCALIIIMGIMIIYLSDHILKRKDRIAWIVLFVIGGIIFWPAILTIEIIDKNFYTVVASAIGWITFIMGMTIPIRYYMQRQYTEY